MSKRQIQIIDKDGEYFGTPGNPLTSFSAGSILRQFKVVDRSCTLLLEDKIVLPENKDRLYLVIQNPNRFPIWIEFGQAAAVAGFPSLRIAAGATFTCDEPSVPFDEIHAIALVNEALLVIKEGIPAE